MRTPLPKTVPSASHVEGPALPDGRHHRSRLVPVTDLVRDAQRHTSGKRHVAFTAEQALAGQVDRNQ